MVRNSWRSRKCFKHLSTGLSAVLKRVECAGFKYFDVSPTGQLLNPAVMQGGKLMPLDSPLDTAPLNPNITADQEMAIRVASKMARVALSDGRRGAALLRLRLDHHLSIG